MPPAEKPIADKLVTCSACGTKNVSQRTVCLSCGGELPISKEGTEPASQPFVPWLRSFAKNLNTPTKWSIAALVVVGTYFGLTWFFFGSSHPCGILEARERPYVEKRYVDSASAMLSGELERDDRSQRALEEAIRSADLLKIGAAIRSIEESGKRSHEYLQDYFDAPKKAVHDLHEKIWNHYTPAGCFWQALAWNPNPYKGSPPLKDILKAEE